MYRRYTHRLPLPSYLVEIFSLARVTETPILDRKVKCQGHKGRLKFRIDAESAATLTDICGGH